MSAAAPLKILAIDNERLLLHALQRAFKGRPLNIRPAYTPAQALDEIDSCSYDLFMLDFDAKDQACVELLKTIDRRCPYVPIIVMTTSDRKSPHLHEAIRMARKQGTWHLLEKPFSLNTMARFVETIFDDKENLKLGLGPITCNYDEEKRHHFRRPHVQPIKVSYKVLVDGHAERRTSKAIVTDISDCGSGILTHEYLPPGQLLSFEDAFPKNHGTVAWSVMLEENTCRCGIQFC